MRMRNVVVGAVVGLLAVLVGCVADPAPDYESELSELRSTVEALHAAVCAELVFVDAKRELLQIEVQSLHGILPPPRTPGGRNLIPDVSEPNEPQSEKERRWMEVLGRIYTIPPLPRLSC